MTLSEVMASPLAPTPLSDEVARIHISRYVPQANADEVVAVHCNQTLSIVDVAKCSNAIVMTVNAVAADLVCLDVTPAMDATARFSLATVARCQGMSARRILRELQPQ